MTDTTVSWRSVALPVEHGGWGFVLEPVVLGLLVAPTAAGASLSAAGLLAFLARHPLRLVLADARRGRAYPRTRLALVCLAGYSSAAALAAGAALVLATGAFWWPLLAAAPLAALQLGYDSANRGREAPAELAGSAAAGAVAAAIAIAGGWQTGPALWLWALLAARAVSSVLYVRARLRLERGRIEGHRASATSHVGALAVASAAVWRGGWHWFALVPFVFLAGRAALGLSRLRRPARPQAVGITELAFGLATAVALATAWCLRPG